MNSRFLVDQKNENEEFSLGAENGKFKLSFYKEF